MKLVASCLLVVCMSTLSSATVVTFTGDVDYVDTSTAAIFGIVDGTTTGTFTVTFTYDGTLTTETAEDVLIVNDVDSGFSYQRASYNYESLSWQVGALSWTHEGTISDGPSGADFFVVWDGIDDGSIDVADRLMIWGGTDQTLLNGYILEHAYLMRYAWDESFSSGLDVSHLAFFNDLPINESRLLFYNPNTGDGKTIHLSNVRMIVAVPEPDPLPLLMVGLGLLLYRKRAGT